MKCKTNMNTTTCSASASGYMVHFPQALVLLICGRRSINITRRAVTIGFYRYATERLLFVFLLPEVPEERLLRMNENKRISSWCNVNTEQIWHLWRSSMEVVQQLGAFEHWRRWWWCRVMTWLKETSDQRVWLELARNLQVVKRRIAIFASLQGWTDSLMMLEGEKSMFEVIFICDWLKISVAACHWTKKKTPSFTKTPLWIIRTVLFYFFVTPLQAEHTVKALFKVRQQSEQPRSSNQPSLQTLRFLAVFKMLQFLITMERILLFPSCYKSLHCINKGPVPISALVAWCHSGARSLWGVQFCGVSIHHLHSWALHAPLP